MSDDVIFFKELGCYKRAGEKEKGTLYYRENQKFDLGRVINESIKEDLKEYVSFRGEKLSCSSLRAELTGFNTFVAFINEEYPELVSMANADFDKMLYDAKKWLIKKGKTVYYNVSCPETGYIERVNAGLIKYIMGLEKYYNPEISYFDKDADVWYLPDFPYELQVNPVKDVHTINFEKIKQTGIKKELKEVIYLHLIQVKVGTVQSEMSAMRNFAAFLFERFPDIDSFSSIDRNLFEEYLVYLNTEYEGCKSNTRILHGIGSVFRTASKVFDIPRLSYLILPEDIEAQPRTVLKTYSKEDRIKLNKCIKELEPQLFRIFYLQQRLGTSIGDLASITVDNIIPFLGDEKVLFQDRIKTGNPFSRLLEEEEKKVLIDAINESKRRWPNTKYVFADSKKDRPIQYSRIYSNIRKMIYKNQLTDSEGRLLKPGTQIWRSTFATDLCNLEIDDAIIAELLGHKNTRSLKHYREVSSERLAEGTKKRRDTFGRIIQDIVKGWDDNG